MVALTLALLVALQPKDTSSKRAGGLPLTPTRTVRFTTDEGTWLSLDVSPDGRSIVFDLVGDLYTLPIEGGRATRITAGPAWDAAPRYSPDGKTIVFVSDRSGSENLWVADRESGKTFMRTGQFQSAMRPTLSPDGRWLVYATRKGAAGALRLRDLSSGDDRWLVENGQRDDQEGAGSRDLAPGSSFTPDSRALITSYGGKIMRVEVPSGRATVIPFSADVEQQIGPLAKFDYPAEPDTVVVRHIQWPRPSPDGRRIAFTALARLY